MVPEAVAKHLFFFYKVTKKNTRKWPQRDLFDLQVLGQNKFQKSLKKFTHHCQCRWEFHEKFLY
jgi:hypothetical protein